MKKIQTKAIYLSETAIIEQAKSLANRWIWAVALQYDRITVPRSQDKAFHPYYIDTFNEADVHFLAIALRRLRAVATIIEYAPDTWDSVRKAIQTFDNSLPWLKRLRDVFEHLEDYAVDSNFRRSQTSCQELQVWSASENGMQWLGYDVDWKKALIAAKHLYGAVKEACDSFLSQSERPND